jgi:hypothetical protein
MDWQRIRIPNDFLVRDIESISQLNPEYARGTGTNGVESAKGSRAGSSAGSSANSVADSEVDD